MHTVLHTLLSLGKALLQAAENSLVLTIYYCLWTCNFPWKKLAIVYHTNVIYPERSLCLCESRIHHPTKNIQSALQNAKIFVAYRKAHSMKIILKTILKCKDCYQQNIVNNIMIF